MIKIYNVNLYRVFAVSLLALTLGACGSKGSSSSGGGGEEARQCVFRTLSTIYRNECDYDVNVTLLKPGALPFRIPGNEARTRSASGRRFGVCRAPSVPVLNSSAEEFTCS